jgi:hypothetical protein
MWIDLTQEQKVQVLEQTGVKKGLPAFVVEKDWWVCMVLRAIFRCKYADSIIFKGGTSLSKAYGLIERFSEDIDLIIDRHLLGFDKLDSGTKIKKLRKASGSFIVNEFREELMCQLDQMGIDRKQYEVRYNEHVDDTSDPNTLEIYYSSVVPVSSHYIQQRVLLEMGARSLTEPIEQKPIVSFIDEIYSTSSFAQKAFDVKVVLPIRTFIEKVLLLHEEFSKPIDSIRVDRLTRHLYDLDKMMLAGHGQQAIADDELFNLIVEHRKIVNPLRRIDYSNHKKGKLRILPPDKVTEEWKSDYKTMQENMIVGESLSWSDLLKSIKDIENLFNR